MTLPINGPTYVFGDNMSVIKNTLKPQSTLCKKSNIICYHFAPKAVAMKECLTTNITTILNLADLLTKVLSCRKKRELVQGVMWDIYDYVLPSSGPDSDESG